MDICGGPGAGILCAALIAWNLTGFVLMGADKRRAKLGRWRIPEKTFFFFAFCFGRLGILAGMKLFHHKTQHLSFRVGVPTGILLDCALIAFLMGWA